MSPESLDRGAALREIVSPEPAQRRLGACALARWGDPEVVRALAGALSDVDGQVRDAAASSLLAVGGAEAVAQLVPLIHADSHPLRTLASMLLEQLGRAEPESLRRLSADPDPRIRLFAATLMSDTGDHDYAPRLIEMLHDTDLNVQDAAADGLGLMRAASAVPVLCARLRAGDPWTRYSTIDALGRIGGRDALAVLLEAVPRTEPELRVAFVEAISMTGLPEAAGGLLELLSRNLDLGPVIAREFLGALSFALGGPAFQTPAIVALLADGLIRGPGGSVLRALKSPAACIRAAAAEAVRVRWITEAVPALCRLRSDPDAGVRAAATESLMAFERARKERI